MTTITLKKLQTEGRLSLGDTLHHSETGDHEFIGATEDGKLIVLDGKKTRHFWSIDFGPDSRVVPVAEV
jgi:hypothetical protein